MFVLLADAPYVFPTWQQAYDLGIKLGYLRSELIEMGNIVYATGHELTAYMTSDDY